LPAISALISAHLQAQALALSRILSPSTNASYLHRTIPKLTPSIHTLLTTNRQKKAALYAARQNLAVLAVRLLQAYQAATGFTVKVLETTKHGSLSLERHYEVRMRYLAQTMEKVRLEALEKRGRGERMVYTDSVKAALGEYKLHLRDARERLRERKGGAERVLWGYGVGREDSKEKVMREIARVYGELVREIGDVGRDVGRLRDR
ncbi:Uncharacterized protein LSUE1_G007271, partial [Lachnellula suecica]